MCEYQRVYFDGVHSVSRCIATKGLCTLCVLGNGKTYKEAKERENIVGRYKHDGKKENA